MDADEVPAHQAVARGDAVAHFGNTELSGLVGKLQVEPALGDGTIGPGLNRVALEKDLHHRHHAAEPAGEGDADEEGADDRRYNHPPIRVKKAAGAPELPVGLVFRPFVTRLAGLGVGDSRGAFTPALAGWKAIGLYGTKNGRRGLVCRAVGGEPVANPSRLSDR